MAMRAIQKAVADFSYIIGAGMMYGGGLGLLSMAIIGTVSLDIVLLAYAEKKHNDFMTGWILASMFFGPKQDPVPLLIASPITSLIAVALSFALEVPHIGLAILAGWAIASTLFVVGLGLMVASESLQPEPERNMAFGY